MSKEKVSKKAMWEEKDMTKEEFFLEYMESRYQEDFTFYEDYIDNNGNKRDGVYLRSDKFGDMNIIAFYYPESDTFSDNYVRYYFRDSVEEELNSLVSQVYSDYKLYFDLNTPVLKSESPEMSVQDYMIYRSSIMGIPFMVFTEEVFEEAEMEIKHEQLRQLLEDKGYRAQILIGYLIEGKLKIMEADTYNKEINHSTANDWLHHEVRFLMDKEDGFKTFDWRRYDE